MREPTSVGVVVPARDEADSIVACLAALARSAGRVPVPVRAVVVVNGTTDATARLARAAGARVVELGRAGVGAARAAGVEAALAGRDPDRTWLATTDADSLVPPDWLEHHLALASAGADAVVGTVRLAGPVLAAHHAWHQEYLAGLARAGHRHVHGANLSFSARAYVDVGGFTALPAHEDADLVQRLDASGRRVVRSVAAPVTTSARTTGRAPAGVARDLRVASSVHAGQRPATHGDPQAHGGA